LTNAWFPDTPIDPVTMKRPEIDLKANAAANDGNSDITITAIPRKVVAFRVLALIDPSQRG
jgi:hypothetical protein